jgi:hypothetical protein
MGLLKPIILLSRSHSVSLLVETNKSLFNWIELVDEHVIANAALHILVFIRGY